MFFIQSVFFYETKRFAFKEPIETWRHGPVVRDEYNKYKIYIQDDIDFERYEEKVHIIIENQKLKEIIYKVCNKTFNIDDWDLVAFTQKCKIWKE